MADKSTAVLVTDNHSMDSNSRVMPEQDAEAAFEHAYWTNSYPKEETNKTKSLSKCVRVLVYVAVSLEVLSMFGIFLAVIKFSHIVSRVDSVITFGTLASLVSSSAKIISAVNAHCYVSKRIDRTPEKREQTA